MLLVFVLLAGREDTGSVLVKDLPTRLKTCSFTWRNRGGQQPIANPVFVRR
jgi:hypothetical protein